MWKTKRFIIIAAVVGVVLVGTVAGVALAQAGNDGTTTTPGKTLIARVAAILGIDQQTVEDAVKQAKQDMQNEALDARLQAMVDSGKITAEQAQEYKDWWQARPQDVLPNVLPNMRRGFFGREKMGMGWRQPTPSQTSPSTQTQ